MDKGQAQLPGKKHSILSNLLRTYAQARLGAAGREIKAAPDFGLLSVRKGLHTESAPKCITEKARHQAWLGAGDKRVQAAAGTFTAL
ncbi:hypothetical protein ALP89_102012 [Pseudomonas syringae pv. persicae]|nr:hypothetical protein ALP89_102012 [Pseudomonas syringae pv. persicae]